MEEQWAVVLKSKKKVEVEMFIPYDVASKRPKAAQVVCSIGEDDFARNLNYW